MTIVEAARGVTGGVDTHLDVHVAAALDPLGALLGSEPFATTPSGYKELLAWLEGFGDVAKVGVEGTGSYGAGLARYLRRSGVKVIEVDRPNRAARRRSGKSDPLDAIEAARAALGGRAQGQAKTKDGAVEAIRVLVIAKRSARQSRVKALTQIRNLGLTAPDQLRCRSKGSRSPRSSPRGPNCDRGDRPIQSRPPPRLPSRVWRTGSNHWNVRLPTSTSCSPLFSPPPHPSYWVSSASVPTRPPLSWWQPATTPNGSIQRPPGPICAACPRYRRPRAR